MGPVSIERVAFSSYATARLVRYRFRPEADTRPKMVAFVSELCSTTSPSAMPALKSACNCNRTYRDISICLRVHRAKHTINAQERGRPLAVLNVLF